MVEKLSHLAGGAHPRPLGGFLTLLSRYGLRRVVLLPFSAGMASDESPMAEIVSRPSVMAYRRTAGPWLRPGGPNLRWPMRSVWSGGPGGHVVVGRAKVPLLLGPRSPSEAIVGDVDGTVPMVACLLVGRGRPRRWGSTSPAPARIGACYAFPCVMQ